MPEEGTGENKSESQEFWLTIYLCLARKIGHETFELIFILGHFLYVNGRADSISIAENREGLMFARYDFAPEYTLRNCETWTDLQLFSS